MLPLSHFYFILCFIVSGLFSPAIHDSEVFVSSLVQGSLPQYAIDADFLQEKPTCLQTNSIQPDKEGFHWVLVDFGILVENVAEVRLDQSLNNEDKGWLSWSQY